MIRNFDVVNDRPGFAKNYKVRLKYDTELGESEFALKVVAFLHLNNALLLLLAWFMRS